jgi:hypothetical protein
MIKLLTLGKKYPSVQQYDTIRTGGQALGRLLNQKIPALQPGLVCSMDVYVDGGK